MPIGIGWELSQSGRFAKVVHGECGEDGNDDVVLGRAGISSDRIGKGTICLTWEKSA